MESKELIARYVYAVTRSLPEKTRADVGKELNGAIEDMLQERGGTEPYSLEETRIVLRQFGNPQDLAEKYSGSRVNALIGAPYYRIYLKVLKIVLPAVGGALVLAGLVKLMTQETALTFMNILGGIQTLFSALMMVFAYATLIFAILYGLGLRVGEACRLCVKDVDLDRRVLVIRQTKFYKSRLVPFGPKLEALLRQQIVRCRTGLYGSADPETALFRLKGGRAVSPGTVSITFQQLVRRLHFMIPPGVSPPRLHDLRHSCAVGTLARWYRDGGDPQARLHILSTFLGHVDINSTAIYLTTTPELLDLANRRFEAFAAATLREGLA